MVLTAAIGDSLHFCSSFSRSKEIVQNDVECELSIHKIDDDKDGVIDQVNLVLDLVLPNANSLVHRVDLMVFPEMHSLVFFY